MQMVEEEVNNIDMMGLSTREMEIIDLVADGLTNQEIAVKLTISKRTVDNQSFQVCQKDSLVPLYTQDYF